MFDFQQSVMFLAAELLSDNDFPQIKVLTEGKFMNLPIVLPHRDWEQSCNTYYPNLLFIY